MMLRILRDNQTLSTHHTYASAMGELHRIQPHSVAWATMYEGYEIVTEDDYAKRWHDLIAEGVDMSMGELATQTHHTQVGIWGWCMCEDNEGNTNPYDDCPTLDNPPTVSEILEVGGHNA